MFDILLPCAHGRLISGRNKMKMVFLSVIFLFYLLKIVVDLFNSIYKEKIIVNLYDSYLFPLLGYK